MDKELKQKWLDALESGDYKQDTGRLKTLTGYCCLGVLCKVLGEEIDITGYYVKSYLDKLPDDDNYEYFDAYIPKEHLRQLYTINDSSKSFEPVIEYIKTNL
jgi:hypothetical protein